VFNLPFKTNGGIIHLHLHCGSFQSPSNMFHK